MTITTSCLHFSLLLSFQDLVCLCLPMPVTLQPLHFSRVLMGSAMLCMGSSGATASGLQGPAVSQGNPQSSPVQKSSALTTPELQSSAGSKSTKRYLQVQFLNFRCAKKHSTCTIVMILQQQTTVIASKPAAKAQPDGN